LDPKNAPQYSDVFPKFISVAGWLQVVNGNRAIWLPEDRLEELLGVRKETIRRYKRAAIKEGYLRQVKGSAPGRPTGFRFDVRRFELLNEAAEREPLKRLVSETNSDDDCREMPSETVGKAFADRGHFWIIGVVKCQQKDSETLAEFE
jgi:hypothetical protein